GKQVSHLYTQMPWSPAWPDMRASARTRWKERNAVMNGRNTPPPDTKVLSVRVPASEVSRIDADAKDAGMNRNDFMRMRIRGESTFMEADKIIQLIDVLRQLERMMDAYLSILERLVENHEETNGKESFNLVLDEMKRARELMELLFKAQRQAVWTLRHIRREERR
ncbi:MAG: ribbon-helix-helix protein, CopG family, partial [Eggerthellaceae bacterium]|nr:ribbon-helix-helix protein, CopG family [Eggerthellaceae bacterium]